MFHNRVLILGDNFRMSSSGSAASPLRYLLQCRDCTLRSLSSLLAATTMHVSHAIPANKHPNETHSLLRTHECYWIKKTRKYY
ncbi:hypothetical protein ALC57_18845 [Trachymyrmex cornetzi]|uniref:Uncharacterized protein n=1 Tax=Trachymyrmex cornetzi TaxID=471704 RepID=A0A195D8Y0_9HYME|nr:hypothetical protein ALC57_18845 [Trachymyrmex cornetzi]